MADNSFLWRAFCLQQDIVENSLDRLTAASVRLHTLDRHLSLSIKRVHPKILFNIVVSKLVFPSVKILINEYSCLQFRPRRIGGNEHSL